MEPSQLVLSLTLLAGALAARCALTARPAPVPVPVPTADRSGTEAGR